MISVDAVVASSKSSGGGDGGGGLTIYINIATQQTRQACS